MTSIKAAIHHFNKDNLEEILGGIKKHLVGSGKLVVQKSSADTWDHLPYPQIVCNAKKEEDYPSEMLKELMLGVGFKNVELHTHRFPIKISKVNLFEGFRQRDISILATLDDQQIEDGIQEVDSRYPGNDVNFTTNRDVIVATL